MDNTMGGNKSGYLNNDFQLFHLKDKINLEFEYHYHEFDKIIIFLSGKVTYIIEGKSYHLKPWDILLVGNHDIHKPIIDPTESYERIIIWASPDFIKKHNYAGCDLSSCFKLSKERYVNLIRLDDSFQSNLKQIIASLEESMKSNEFGSQLLSNSLFIQFLIYLNRIYSGTTSSLPNDTLKYDKQVETILKYINSNLTENLSIDILCNMFYVNKYYLMHKFKKETGYTVHNYIMQKRIFKANDMITNGIPASKAAESCGFKDYSTFLRTYKKYYKTTPRKKA